MAAQTGVMFAETQRTDGNVHVRVNVMARITDAGDVVHVGDVEGGQYRSLCDEYADDPYFATTRDGVTCSACLAYVAEWQEFYAGRNNERDRTPVAEPVAERVAGADELRAYVGQRITLTTEVTTRQILTDGPNDETLIHYEPVNRVTSGVLADVDQRGSATVAVFEPRFNDAGTWLGTDRHDFGSHQPTTVAVIAAKPEPEPVADGADFSGTVRLADAAEKIGAEMPEGVAEPVAAVAEPVAQPESGDGFDLEAAQRSHKLRERARKAVVSRRWTDKPGGRWHLSDGDMPYYPGTYAKASIFTTDDGTGYEVYLFAFHDGSELARVTLKGLDAAFRRGERMADTAPEPAGQAGQVTPEGKPTRTVFVTVTSESGEVLHSETRRAWNAGIRASESAVREIARREGVLYSGTTPVREGERDTPADTYLRSWSAPDGTALVARVGRTEVSTEATDVGPEQVTPETEPTETPAEPTAAELITGVYRAGVPVLHVAVMCLVDRRHGQSREYADESTAARAVAAFGQAVRVDRIEDESGTWVRVGCEWQRGQAGSYAMHEIACAFLIPVHCERVPEPVAEAAAAVDPEGVGQAGPEQAAATPDADRIGAEIMARAVDAYASGDLAGALAAVAEGETVAPEYRAAGESGAVYGWAEMRASLPTEPVEAVAEQAPTDGFHVEAEHGGVYRVTLYAAGRMVDRRRDVSAERVDAVKDSMRAAQTPDVAEPVACPVAPEPVPAWRIHSRGDRCTCTKAECVAWRNRTAEPIGAEPTPAEHVADMLQLTTDGEAEAFPADAPSVADRTAVPVAAEPEPEQGQLFACADTRKAARANFGDLGMIDGLGNIAPDAVAEPEAEATPDAEPEQVGPEVAAVAWWARLDMVDSDALAVALSVMADRTPDDADTLHAVGDACDRAQGREQARIDELVRRGWPEADAVAEVTHADPGQIEREDIRARVDADRRAGETRAQTVRRQYDEAVAGWFVQAETACRGHLLTPAGVAASVDPRSLWCGPAWRVEQYASEELREWFTTHGRVTVAEWREQCGTVARPVSAPPAPVAEVPETAAEVVAGWEADDMPAPVSPAAPAAPSGQATGQGRVPLVIAGNVARVGYRPGTAVRSVLKQVRPEVLRRTRDAELKTARCSIVPDREAREVSVTLEGAEGADVARVWAIVAEVMAAHGFHALADAVPVGA